MYVVCPASGDDLASVGGSWCDLSLFEVFCGHVAGTAIWELHKASGKDINPPLVPVVVDRRRRCRRCLPGHRIHSGHWWLEQTHASSRAGSCQLGTQGSCRSLRYRMRCPTASYPPRNTEKLRFHTATLRITVSEQSFS